MDRLKSNCWRRMVASNMCLFWLMPKELAPANSRIAFKAPPGFRLPSAIQSTFPERRLG